MLEKITVFLQIFILLTCAVYAVVRVAKAITQKPPAPEKESLCDSCEHLVHKGGDIEPGKYKCGFFNGSFYNSPEFCRDYKQRQEKNEEHK